jgi:uncharacterized protein YcbX
MTDVAIAALSLHPVKSCRAIAVERAEVATTGLRAEGVRDREWMVVDPQGRFVTQREMPRMALIEPVIAGGVLTLTVPGFAPFVLHAQGDARDVVVWRSHVRGFDAGDAVAQALSTFLDAAVRLVRFDDGMPRPCSPDFVGASGATTLFADGYPLLVVGRASLDDLNTRLRARGFPPVPMNRFRPNVVVDGLAAGDEDHVDTLTFGDVELRLVKPCTRCAIITTDQATACRNLEPLRTLSTYRRDDRLAGVTFGMNAIVVGGAGATLAVGARGQAEFRFTASAST